MEVSGQFHVLAALPPGVPVTHRIGGWLGTRAGLHAMENREVSTFRQELNSDF